MQTSIINNRVRTTISEDAHPNARKSIKHMDARKLRRTSRVDIHEETDDAPLENLWAGDCAAVEIEKPVMVNTIFGTQEVAA